MISLFLFVSQCPSHSKSICSTQLTSSVSVSKYDRSKRIPCLSDCPFQGLTSNKSVNINKGEEESVQISRLPPTATAGLFVCRFWCGLTIPSTFLFLLSSQLTFWVASHPIPATATAVSFGPTATPTPYNYPPTTSPFKSHNFDLNPHSPYYFLCSSLTSLAVCNGLLHQIVQDQKMETQTQ